MASTTHLPRTETQRTGCVARSTAGARGRGARSAAGLAAAALLSLGVFGTPGAALAHGTHRSLDNQADVTVGGITDCEAGAFHLIVNTITGPGLTAQDVRERLTVDVAWSGGKSVSGLLPTKVSSDSGTSAHWVAHYTILVGTAVSGGILLDSDRVESATLHQPNNWTYNRFVLSHIPCAAPPPPPLPALPPSGPNLNETPEVGSLLLFGSGSLGMAGFAWWQRRRRTTDGAPL